MKPLVKTCLMMQPWVYDVGRVIRIRTGEEDESAI